MNPRRELQALAPVAGEVLESLYQHRLLSTRQIHQMHTPDSGPRWTRKLLAGLRHHELVDFARAADGDGSVYFLTTRGAQIVEQVTPRTPARRKLIAPAEAAGLFRAHTLAVNDTGIAFMQAARERPDDEFGALAWVHEVSHPIGKNKWLTADALLTYQQYAKRDVLFRYRFLELDRATQPVEKLAAKLASYARLYHHTPSAQKTPGWRTRYEVFPDVICVLAGESDVALERRTRSVLALCQDDRELRQTPEVGISICTITDLTAQGPFAAIWRRPWCQQRLGWLDASPAGRRRR
ncbi:MAG TPA: replication-relaxation family protein [Solirubrobacteraceae bacterium]|nr:replication-relaxation family protein [Solirubrobacteraceae bacterium]